MGTLEFFIHVAIGYASGIGVTSGFFFQLISNYLVRGKGPWREYVWLVPAIANILLVGFGVLLIAVMVLYDKEVDGLKAAIPFLIGLVSGFAASIGLAHFVSKGLIAREAELRAEFAQSGNGREEK